MNTVPKIIWLPSIALLPSMPIASMPSASCSTIPETGAEQYWASSRTNWRRPLVDSRSRTYNERHELHYNKALVEIISMVKHAANAEQPLYTAAERVNRAFSKVTAGREFTAEQQQWLDRIKQTLIATLSIDRDDFEVIPIFDQAGGWGRADKAFAGQLADILSEINEAIAA